MSKARFWPGVAFALVLSSILGCDRSVPPEVATATATSGTAAEGKLVGQNKDHQPVLISADSVSGQDWGTVTGQIVFGGDPLPVNPEANVDKDKSPCLAKGPILKNELVVNKKNKGIRWALVWLTEAEKPKSTKALPIHPALMKMDKQVSIDQPCCEFEPRVMGMREGQSLLIKNSMSIAHNTAINGGLAGPNINPLIPPKSEYEVAKEKIKARYIPLLYTCSIHGWMKGYIGVFNHPYFAVTDADGKFTLKNAPAGKYRLLVWHEQGWVIMDPKDPANRGRDIDIKANGTTDVGKISFVPSKD